MMLVGLPSQDALWFHGFMKLPGFLETALGDSRLLLVPIPVTSHHRAPASCRVRAAQSYWDPDGCFLSQLSHPTAPEPQEPFGPSLGWVFPNLQARLLFLRVFLALSPCFPAERALGAELPREPRPGRQCVPRAPAGAPRQLQLPLPARTRRRVPVPRLRLDPSPPWSPALPSAPPGRRPLLPQLRWHLSLQPVPVGGCGQ